mmetsp:Transcript_14957/g.44323  ORF Transcript_14957/g.44323 Transcript_14957/m.44323 type:complete len:107 (-) Transcript_14957:548-868(-)
MGPVQARPVHLSLSHLPCGKCHREMGKKKWLRDFEVRILVAQHPCRPVLAQGCLVVEASEEPPTKPGQGQPVVSTMHRGIGLHSKHWRRRPSVGELEAESTGLQAP